jgi:predicted dinucleotide-binding enzyme
MSVKLNIAVIGTGHIGGTVGRAAASAGHNVTFGSRSPETDKVAKDSGAQVADVATAISGADVVLVGIPGSAVPQVIEENAAALAGKLVIDASNSMGGASSNHHDTITQGVQNVRYARCFNTLGVENLQDPHFGDEVADMFFSAPEADRPTVEAIISALGMGPAYLGNDQHETVDSVLKLWFTLAMGQHRGRHLAFRVLHR